MKETLNKKKGDKVWVLVRDIPWRSPSILPVILDIDIIYSHGLASADLSHLSGGSYAPSYPEEKYALEMVIWELKFERAKQLKKRRELNNEIKITSERLLKFKNRLTALEGNENEI